MLCRSLFTIVGASLFACDVAVADDSTLAAAVARDRAQFALLAEAKPPFEPLSGSSPVYAQRVEDRIQNLRKHATPQGGVESLGLPGLFKIVPPAVLIGASTAERIRTILAAPESYEPEVRSTCVFSAVAAFSFPTRAELLVIVSSACHQVAFAKGDTLLGTWVMKQEAAQKLFAIVGDVLPAPTVKGNHCAPR